VTSRKLVVERRDLAVLLLGEHTRAVVVLLALLPGHVDEAEVGPHHDLVELHLYVAKLPQDEVAHHLRGLALKRAEPVAVARHAALLFLHLLRRASDALLDLGVDPAVKGIDQTIERVEAPQEQLSASGVSRPALRRMAASRCTRSRSWRAPRRRARSAGRPDRSARGPADQPAELRGCARGTAHGLALPGELGLELRAVEARGLVRRVGEVALDGHDHRVEPLDALLVALQRLRERWNSFSTCRSRRRRSRRVGGRRPHLRGEGAALRDDALELDVARVGERVEAQGDRSRAAGWRGSGAATRAAGRAEVLKHVGARRGVQRGVEAVDEVARPRARRCGTR
jgi:hypothetical protein